MSEDPRPSGLLSGLVRANEWFYRVFEKLDYAAMEALWEKSERVFCVHPGWSPLYGEKPVMDSWKRIIENTAAMHFELVDVRARLEGDIGVVTLIELIHSQVGQERHNSGAVSTNLFAYDSQAGVWKLYHHHASNAAVPDNLEHGPLN